MKSQGSNATGGCCSKCWREQQKKNGEAAETEPTPAAKPMETEPESAPTPMEVDEKPAEPTKEVAVAKAAAAPATTTPKKRKKKKASYKNMMSGMMKSGSPSRDIEKEKETLRKVTGGGAFSKIDKI